jgi:uncharacterized tellurite resistance protein B-like protein
MIKEHMNKEHMNKEQEKREEVLKLLDNIKQNTSLKNNANTREKIVHLLGYNLLRKTKKLSKKESNTINQIKTNNFAINQIKTNNFGNIRWKCSSLS